MMDLKPFEGHTPGPWEVTDIFYDHYGKGKPHHERMIVTSWENGQLHDKMPVAGVAIGIPEKKGEPAVHFLHIEKADANLMAASPDLLAENIALTEKCRKLAEALQEISTILDNYLGDTDPDIPEDWTDDDIRSEEPILYACRKANNALAKRECAHG